MTSKPPILDLDFVRGCFPAFEQPLPKATAFFENAGGSYVAGAVLERLIHFYRANKVQPYGISEILRTAGEQMDAGRQTMADLLGVPKETVTLGPSTTQNINTLAVACAAVVGAGDKVMVTEQDHEANVGAWQRLCQRSGAELVTWEVDPQTGELSLEACVKLLDPQVKILCMTHSSNIIGTVNPVEEVIALCRKNGTHIILDGVSYAPHRWPTPGQLKPDAYCFSTYKTYATHLGVMYSTPAFTELLDPQCHYFNRECAEKRLDAAGPDHASIAALVGLGEYFAASFTHHFGQSSSATASPQFLHSKTTLLSTLMHEHEHELCAHLLEEIAGLPLRVIGRSTMENREANIALVSAHHSSKQLSAALAAKNIAAGHGHFYAKRLLEKVGIKDSEDGVLRISFSHYNTAEEVERVCAVLRAL